MIEARLKSIMEAIILQLSMVFRSLFIFIDSEARRCVYLAVEFILVRSIIVC